MLKAFFKRIVTEVIKELISPELASIRAEIKGVETSLRGEIERVEARMDRFEERLDRINKRLDDLYLVVVRRDEHTSLEDDVKRLREDVEVLKRKAGI